MNQKNVYDTIRNDGIGSRVKFALQEPKALQSFDSKITITPNERSSITNRRLLNRPNSLYKPTFLRGSKSPGGPRSHNEDTYKWTVPKYDI